MQINLSASLSGSKAEPAAGAAEHTDKNPAGAFFAQIDQVLNAGREQEETAQAEKPDAQASPVAEADSVALILNSALAAGSLQTRETPVESLLDAPAAIPACELKEDVPLAGRGGFREEAFIPDTPITAALEVSKGDTSAPIINAGMPQIPETAGDGSREQRQGSHASPPHPRSEPGPVKAQSGPVVAQPLSTEASASEPNTTATGSEWSEATGSLHSKDIPQSYESTGLRENVQQTAGPARFEYSAQFEHAGAENSEAGRDSQRNDSTPRIAQPNRMNHSQASGEISSAAGERLEISSPLNSIQPRSAFTEAPSVVSRPVAASHQPGEFILQLAERIRFQLRDGKGEIRIQLRPDSLGCLEIRAESSLNGVVARIFAESNAVKNYLESSLHLLQQSLQEQGLKIDRVQVSVQEGFGSPSSAGYTLESGNTSPGYHGRGSGRIPAATDFSPPSSQEELAVDLITWVSLNPNVRFHTIA